MTGRVHPVRLAKAGCGVLARLLGLLDTTERLELLKLLPWVIFAALFEIVGVAAVIPFLSLLSDPASIGSVPFIGAWLTGLDMDPIVLLRWLGLGVAVSITLVNIVMILTNWKLLRFSWGLNHRVSSRLLKHYLAQRYDFLLNRNSASLANNVLQEVTRITEQGVGATVELMAKSVAALAIVGFLISLDPALAVISLLSLVGAYAAIYIVTKGLLGRIGREATALNASRLRIVNEALGGFKELKVMGREATVMEQYLIPSRRYADVRAISSALSRLPRFALEAVAVGGMVVIASLMAGRSGSFSSTVPILGAYAFAGLRLMPALQSIFSAVTQIRFAAGAIEAVEADFAQAKEFDAGISDARPARLEFDERIELKAVSYSYPNASRPALKGVDLSIPKCGRVALVGRTGSGKTTLADVILGLLPPAEGLIEVDGVGIERENLASYRQLFGYVPQNIFLTDGTVFQNVAFGVLAEKIDEDAVRRACEAAQLHDFIMNDLPERYDTVVGERGIRLSGGQRQRIGIARALYYDPPVLIFDEATSALDVHTERAVYTALDAIAKTRTVITIAHRLETVADAELVVVMEQGQIQERGPAPEILARYRKQAKSQAVNLP